MFTSSAMALSIYCILAKRASFAGIFPGKLTKGTGGASHIQLFALKPAVELRDEFAIAVVQLRRHLLIAAENALARLAPARMRHVRVHIRPEAIFIAGQLLPEAHRPLF